MLFDFAALSSNGCCKLLVATVAPRPIAWVITQDSGGALNLAVHVRDNAVLDQERCHTDGLRLRQIGRMHGAGWYAGTNDLFEAKRISPASYVRKT